MIWPHLKILWHGEDNSAWYRERSPEKGVRKREKHGKITSKNGQELSLEIPIGQQKTEI